MACDVSRKFFNFVEDFFFPIKTIFRIVNQHPSYIVLGVKSTIVFRERIKTKYIILFLKKTFLVSTRIFVLYIYSSSLSKKLFLHQSSLYRCYSLYYQPPSVWGVGLKNDRFRAYSIKMQQYFF